MIKDVWNSFRDNIKERVTNPFLGTFVLVWIVHNWRVVFAFFYFDSDWKLQNKIIYFNSYWAEHNFIRNLFSVALITIFVLVITYLFLAFSRFLSNYFENVVIPFIYKISKGKTVTFETHQKALVKIESLESKVESERKAKNEAIFEREELEKKVYKQAQESEKKENDYTGLVQLLRKNYNLDNFERTLVDISKGYSFRTDDDVNIDFLLKHGLVYVTNKDSSGFIYVTFTEDGLEFRRQYNKSA